MYSRHKKEPDIYQKALSYAEFSPQHNQMVPELTDLAAGALQNLRVVV